MQASESLTSIGLLVTPDDPRDTLIDLMNRYERALHGYVCLLTGNDDRARDCVQDTFLRAYEHLERGRNVNVQWIYKVARNRAMDTHRDRRRDPKTYVGVENVPTKETGSSDDSIRIRAAMRELPLRDQELLYLAIIDRLKSEEIGRLLGIRAGAVRARLLRARIRLRNLYEVAE